MNLSVYDEVLITSDDSDVYNYSIWDLENGDIVDKFDDGTSSKNCLAAVGNDYVISSIKGTNFLKIWPRLENVQAGGLDLICPDRVTAIDVSSSSTYCVGAIDCKLYLWQIVSGKLMCILSMHKNRIEKVKFTSDERYIISYGFDSRLIAWKISDVVNAESPRNLKPAYMWSLRPRSVVDFAVQYFSPENKVFAITSSSCEMYSVETGKRMMVLNLKNSLAFKCIAIDVMGTHLFIGKSDGSVLQIEQNFTPKEEIHHKAKNVPIKELHLHKMAVTCLATSKNGYLISGSIDKTVVVWDILTAQVFRVLLHNGALTNTFFIPSPSLYEKYPHTIIKPFRFEVSSFNIDSWKFELKPLDETKMEWDEDIYGTFNIKEKLQKEESKDNENKQLSKQQVRETEFMNEMLFSYGCLSNFS